MDSYLPLLLVPLLCAPLQNLYLSAGQRYDLGAITYIATGTFATVYYSDPTARPQIAALLLLLVLLSCSSYILRCFVLAYGSPKDFTLFTFCQLWAVPAVVGYEIERTSSDGAMGVYIPSIHHSNLTIVEAALAVSLLITVILARTSTTVRFVLFTEAPEQYQLLFGSRLRLAWKVETCAFFVYLISGIAFRLIISDISGAIFGTESIWCLLSAAVIVRKWQRFVIVGPIIVTFARMLINQAVDSRYSLLFVYFLLAICLAVVNSNAKRASRELVG